MNEMEAAVGIGNLEIYEEILRKRSENLYYLMEKFKKFSPYLVTIEKQSYEEIGPHALPIIIQEQARFSRNEFIDFLNKKGIDSRTLFASMPTQCPGFGFLGYKMGDFSEAEYVGNNGLHIGIHQDLGREECDYFIDTVDKFLAQNL
jgi:dTDP-4-amino-4,6-dideoxygalactose transaminase